MTIKLYNTMKRKKEAFGLKKAHVYTCGPTVYSYAHIGNFRAYLFYDLLRRWLEFRGVEVKHVMNITDIDDKTIKGSREAGMSLKEFTRKYETEFFADLEALRISRAHVYPRATEHVHDMVDMIRKLMLKGYAYRAEDGSTYFRIKKFKKYGSLSKLKMKSLRPGARVAHDEYSKQEARDFALWKSWTEGDGEVFWLTQLGKGRPGWHIECSVMAMKYLKEVDIHGGGIDLMFPHHENEIAQSEAAAGKKFSKFWIHCEHLLVDGRKMSKSLGNTYTVRDLINRSHETVAFRYLALSSHYRSQLNFTWQALENANKTVDNFNDFLRRLQILQNESKAAPNHRLHVAIKKARDDFERHMDNDLSTPQALAAVFKLIKKVNIEVDKNRADRKSLQAVEKFLLQANSIFDILQKEEEITQEEKMMIEQREQARREKNFAEADRIRGVLKEKGITLEDSPQGVMWKKEKR